MMSTIWKRFALALMILTLVSVLSIGYAEGNQGEDSTQDIIVVYTSDLVEPVAFSSIEPQAQPFIEASAGAPEVIDVVNSLPAVPAADPEPSESMEMPMPPEVLETSEAPPLTSDITEVPLSAQEPFRSVTIKLHGTPGSFQYGELVRLEAILSGYYDIAYTLTWEYSANGVDDWSYAPGNNGSTLYEFRLDEVNALWYWRAVVEVHG